MAPAGGLAKEALEITVITALTLPGLFKSIYLK
jgi:hypothetical protein